MMCASVGHAVAITFCCTLFLVSAFSSPISWLFNELSMLFGRLLKDKSDKQK